MIVVEAGHAHVITFLPLSCELSIFVAVCHFLCEKCGVVFELTIESKNFKLFCNQSKKY
jgi:hypothetical protein